MNEKACLLSLLNLPSIYGLYLLFAASIALFMPYLFGLEFGIVRFPIPNKKQIKIFKIVGPFLFVIAVMLHLPIVSLAKPGSFQDFESNNGTSDVDIVESYCRSIWYASCEFDSKSMTPGKRSVRVKVENHQTPVQNGGTVRIFPSSAKPFDLSKAKVITAMVYDTQGSNTVELKLCNGDICPDRSWSSMRSNKDTWTKITWPISSFTKIDIHNISAMEFFEWNDGTYYFDSVEWQ